MECSICAETITTTDKKFELLCGHTYHSICAFRRNVGQVVNEIRCPDCHTYIVPNEIVDEFQATYGQEAANEIITYMWTSNTEFKDSLKSLKVASAELAKTSKIQQKNLKTAIAAAQQEIEPHVVAIKNKMTAAKKEYTQTDENKNMNTASRIYHTKLSVFRKKWGVHMWQVRTVLFNNPEAKRFLPSRNLMYHYHRSGLRGFNVRIRA